MTQPDNDAGSPGTIGTDQIILSPQVVNLVAQNLGTQIINVLRGEMSFVGPRPHAIIHNQEYEQKIAKYARRHNVKPGITGWAQVNGRNTLSWPAKFALDVWYVDHRSFALDLRILAMTVGKVLRRALRESEPAATGE